MNKLFHRLLLVGCAIAVASPAMAGPRGDGPPQVEGRRLGERNRVEAERQQREVYEWLVSERVKAGLLTPLVVEVTREDLEALAREQRKAGIRKVPVGVTKEVSESVSFGDLTPGAIRGRTVRRTLGAIRATSDGGFVWTGAVQSPDALALRVHITGLQLPEGTKLYVYNDSGVAAGPYTGRGPNGNGDLWTNSVSGSIAYLQLRHQGVATRADLARAGFTISGIGHVRGLVVSPEASSLCSDNADCVEDAQCYDVGAVACARDAVARTLFRSGPFLYVCSGGLLADSAGSGTPFFLTANHCISKGREANSMETFFFHENSICGSGDACGSWGDSHTTGATILSTNKTSDYTLLELAQPAPAGACFLGWDTAAVAYSDGATLHRISHPLGNPQAYSEHAVDPSAPTCSSWPRGPRIYSRDVTGATEGGSSGSPVLDNDGQVVGQLSGACGYNVNDPCDSVNNATVDGAFASYYDEVAQWLDPAGCPDADGDGYTDAACGGNDCDDSDPSVNPGAAEVCNDGVDNDCNGALDCSDGACSSDPICSSCTPVGDFCTSDSECCSGKCRGRPGGKTCR